LTENQFQLLPVNKISKVVDIGDNTDKTYQQLKTKQHMKPRTN